MTWGSRHGTRVPWPIPILSQQNPSFPGTDRCHEASEVGTRLPRIIAFQPPAACHIATAPWISPPLTSHPWALGDVLNCAFYVGNGWEWKNGRIIVSQWIIPENSLLSTSKLMLQTHIVNAHIIWWHDYDCYIYYDVIICWNMMTSDEIVITYWWNMMTYWWHIDDILTNVVWLVQKKQHENPHENWTRSCAMGKAVLPVNLPGNKSTVNQLHSVIKHD